MLTVNELRVKIENSQTTIWVGTMSLLKVLFDSFQLPGAKFKNFKLLFGHNVSLIAIKVIFYSIYLVGSWNDVIF